MKPHPPVINIFVFSVKLFNNVHERFPIQNVIAEIHFEDQWIYTGLPSSEILFSKESKIKLLGLHGLSRDAWRRFESVTKRAYDVIDFGYKMNITDLQSSIGIVQLQRLEEMRQRRKEIWKFYLENL